jgi:MFS family permease
VEQLLNVKPKAPSGGGPFVCMSPAAWLINKKLSRDFWIVFSAAFFFDFGISIFVFIFNLYLLELHFNDRSIGLVNSAAVLGSVLGTLPAGLLTRRIGLRLMLTFCLVAAPSLCALRALVTSEPAQIGLGFVAGLALSSWGVCFLPAVARSTTPDNRASGFSLIFSAGVGTGILGGVVCGYLPQWLSNAGFVVAPVDLKRQILLVSCGIAALGVFPILGTRLLSSDTETSRIDGSKSRIGARLLTINPFLLRFLPAMALWTLVLTSFTPFANVYLSRNLHIPLLRIGLIFSAAQVVQFCVTLTTPMLFRTLGLVNGIVATQLLTAVTLGCLAGTQNTQFAVALYLVFYGMQWMSSPGLYNMLMSNVSEEEQSSASSITLFCNAVVGAGSTACAGILFTKFGYPYVLSGIGILAIIAAMVFRILIGPLNRSVSIQPQLS